MQRRLPPDWNSQAHDGGRANLLRSVEFTQKRANGADGMVLVGWSLGGVAAALLTRDAAHFDVTLAHTFCLAGAFRVLRSCQPFGPDQKVFSRPMSDATMSLEMPRLVEAFGYGGSGLERFTITAMKSAFIPFDERLAIIDEVIKPRFAVLIG